MKLGGQFGEVFGPLDAQTNAIRQRLNRLGRGVDDLVLIEGIKLSGWSPCGR